MKKQLLLFFAASFIVAACLIKTAGSGPSASQRRPSPQRPESPRRTKIDLKTLEANLQSWRGNVNFAPLFHAYLQSRETFNLTKQRQELEKRHQDFRAAGASKQDLQDLTNQIEQLQEQIDESYFPNQIAKILKIGQFNPETRIIDGMFAIWHIQSEMIKILKSDLADCQKELARLRGGEGERKARAPRVRKEGEVEGEMEGEPGAGPMAPGGPAPL